MITCPQINQFEVPSDPCRIALSDHTQVQFYYATNLHYEYLTSRSSASLVPSGTSEYSVRNLSSHLSTCLMANG